METIGCALNRLTGINFRKRQDYVEDLSTHRRSVEVLLIDPKIFGGQQAEHVKELLRRYVECCLLEELVERRRLERISSTDSFKGYRAAKEAAATMFDRRGAWLSQREYLRKHSIPRFLTTAIDVINSDLVSVRKWADVVGIERHKFARTVEIFDGSSYLNG